MNFVEGLPLSLSDDSLLPVNKNNLLIIDDLMNDANNNVKVQNVFTKYVHHRNLSCLYLVQNLIFQGEVSRTINSNTNYLVLCKNSRDKYQVMLMARQMFLRKTKFFMECFEVFLMAICLLIIKPEHPTTFVSEPISCQACLLCTCQRTNKIMSERLRRNLSLLKRLIASSS